MQWHSLVYTNLFWLFNKYAWEVIVNVKKARDYVQFEKILRGISVIYFFILMLWTEISFP